MVDESKETQKETFEDYLEGALPGYETMFDSMAQMDFLDEASDRLVLVCADIINNDDIAAHVLKAMYVLGAYNENRGLHVTKH